MMRWGGGRIQLEVDCRHKALKFCSLISSSLRRVKLRPEDMAFSLSNDIG